MRGRDLQRGGGCAACIWGGRRCIGGQQGARRPSTSQAGGPGDIPPVQPQSACRSSGHPSGDACLRGRPSQQPALHLRGRSREQGKSSGQRPLARQPGVGEGASRRHCQGCVRGNVGWPDEAVSRVQEGQEAGPHPPEHHGSPKFGGEAVSKQEIQAPAPPTWCSRLMVNRRRVRRPMGAGRL